MKFVLHPQTGGPNLVVTGDDYKYIIKVRRQSVGDLLSFRSKENLNEECLYRLESVDGRNAHFILENRRLAPCEVERQLHIGWCLVDPKTIEKALPMLCELGVAKITFIHCRRSQRNFRLDFERLERIMESSIMQCGRTSLIELDEAAGLSLFLKAHPNAAIFDFGGETLKKEEFIDTIVIGCEGGFDESERKLFAEHPIRQYASPLIMRSETAVIAAASVMIL